MRQLPWQRVHFTAIGGVGMTGLALILRDFQVQVSGTDEVPSKNLDLLRRRGCTVAVGHAAAHVQQPDLLVFSSAVRPDNPELVAAKAQHVRCVRRGEFLAELAVHFPQVVSVAGSHGKTTTTAMLTHLLRGVGRQPGYMVGGDLAGWPAPASAGDGSILVTEVDESDGTQTAMRSTHAIVTNAEDDHCWSVGGEEALREIFRTFARRADCLVTGDTPETHALFADHPQVEFIGLADIPADLALRVPGAHNRMNATMAIRLAAHLGVAPAAAAAALRDFGGVERRLTVRYQDARTVVVEDYAHHPTEVRASLQALREQFPGRRLRVAFQPHRFERVLRYQNDFARELSLADEVVVTPPFKAWLDDASLADPRQIATAITNGHARFSEESWPALADALLAAHTGQDVIVVMGAGTITALVPLLCARLAGSAPAATGA